MASADVPLVLGVAHGEQKWQAHKETTRAIVLTSSTPENFSSGSDFIGARAFSLSTLSQLS
jgi:hypothetical protein